MATASVEQPLPTAFSEESAHELFKVHLQNEGLIPLLVAFCSNSLPDSEHQLLLDNAKLACEEVVNAVRQVASCANAVNDVTSAYFYHRKAEVLQACMKQGVSDFFTGLHDPDQAMAFFDQVGPPPGYEDDYWGKLIESYKEGDHLQHQIRRQVYEGAVEGQEGVIEFRAIENDESIVDDVTKLLSHKYSGSTMQIAPDAEVRGDWVLESPTLVAMQSQTQERRSLIQEFTQTGLSLLLNWLLSMPPTARFGVLEQCLGDVILSSSLDSVVSVRQRRHLLPEISDLPMLVGEGVDHLQQLIVRVAGGQENSWNDKISVIQPLKESHHSFIARFQANTAASTANTTKSGVNEARNAERTTEEKTREKRSDSDLLLREFDMWAREQSREHWFNVPAVLHIEYAVENVISRFFCPADAHQSVRQSQMLTFETFCSPFALYRTRGLQLFILSLIEKCLKLCLPAAPPTQNKKRKRPM